MPISERLFYQITEHLIPQFFVSSENVFHTTLTSETVVPDYHPTEVGMGMSCGIDSLTSFLQSVCDNKLDTYKVTTLTFFENGAHHLGTIGHDEREPFVFGKQLEHVEKFCKKIGYPLVAIRSNLDEVLADLFWQDSYSSTHSFRNACFVLVIQKLIRTYYYGAAYNLTDFNASLNNLDSAHFDSFLFAYVSTSATSFYVTASEMSRMDKINYLKHYPEVNDSLLVCYKSGRNCGACYKCIRTMVELDVAGVLDNFENSFDLKTYRTNRNKYFYQIYKKKRRNPIHKEIFEYANNHHVSIPGIIKFKGACAECVAIVIERLNMIKNILF